MKLVILDEQQQCVEVSKADKRRLVAENPDGALGIISFDGHNVCIKWANGLVSKDFHNLILLMKDVRMHAVKIYEV